MEQSAPRNTKPAKKAGRCPGKAGEYRRSSNRDNPRKSEPLQALFWAAVGQLGRIRYNDAKEVRHPSLTGRANRQSSFVPGHAVRHCGSAMTDFGSKEEGGFNEFTKAYKKDPSIENYLKLRRENPDAEIEVGVIGGMEQLLYMQHELRRCGIDPNLVAKMMDAIPEAIGELALRLMEKMIEARRTLR